MELDHAKISSLLSSTNLKLGLCEITHWKYWFVKKKEESALIYLINLELSAAS